MENTITISKQEYIMMMRLAERIDTLERMYERGVYVSEDEIRAILDIVTREVESDGKF